LSIIEPIGNLEFAGMPAKEVRTMSTLRIHVARGIFSAGAALAVCAVLAVPGPGGDDEIKAVAFQSNGPSIDGWQWLMDAGLSQTAEWRFDRIPMEQDISVGLDVRARSAVRLAAGVNAEFFLMYGAAAPGQKEAEFFGRVKVALSGTPAPSGDPTGFICRGTVVIPLKELRGSPALILRASRGDAQAEYPPGVYFIGVRAESAVLIVKSSPEPGPRPKPRTIPEPPPQPKAEPRPLPKPEPEPKLRPFTGDHLPETDERDEAYLLKPGAYYGELGHERDNGSHDNVDWYAVNLRRGEIVTVSLDLNEGRNFNLALIAPDGNPLDTSARKLNATDVVECAAGLDGPAFIKINRAAGQGRYALTIAIRRQDDAGSGRDAGGDADGAVPAYPASEPADGQLLPGDNIDVYSVGLERGWTLFAQLLVQSGQNFNLALQRPDGTILEASKRGVGESDEIEFKAPAAKTYYLRVIRKSGEGHYKLQLAIHK
jgi:hypothetical protein